MKTVLTVLTLFGVFLGCRVLPPAVWPERIGATVPQMAVLLTAAAVAMKFERGDRPRRPWVLFAVSAAVLLASRAALWSGLRESSEGLLAASNLVYAMAGVDVYLVLRGNPLIPPMHGRTRLALRLALVLAVVASAVGGGALLARLLEHGWNGEPQDWTRAAAFVGLLCDAAVFVASLEVVALLLPMAGGRAARPYGLLAGAGLIFLVVDLLGFGVSNDFGYDGLGEVLRAFSLVAWALYAAAALEQRRLITRGVED